MEYDIKAEIEKDKKIGVLYGGMSNEREVSLRSGKNVYEALKRLGYKNTVLIDVDENIYNKLKEENIEIVYNALHGKYGEDGCIQGLLEILKIPYTGCGVMSSAICMNKQYTKDILKSGNLNLIKSVLVKSDEDVIEKTKELKYPLMIKPVSEGSSIGMSKATNEEELISGFKVAMELGQDVLIEEFLIGKDLTVGVLEDKKRIFATEILELRVKDGWYDFKAKYTKGMTEFILPAELSPELTEKVKKVAIEAFKTANCKGLSRVDILLSNNIPYILEINTSPGMTDLSDLPAQALKCGINYDNLVQLILNNASFGKQ